MANTAGIAPSFLSECMRGVHALGTTVIRAATTADQLKAALFLASASINPATTTYSATGEVSGTNYSAGGIVVTNTVDPSTVNKTGIWTPSGDFVFTSVTLSSPFDCLQIYNHSQSDKSISVYTFAAQSIMAGTFKLSVPTNDENNALIRIGT